MFVKAIDPDVNQWAGIMTGFAGGIDLSTSQYIEIWINDYTVNQLDRRGILHIDFGKIDEDFHQPELDEFDVENLLNWTNEDDRELLSRAPRMSEAMISRACLNLP